MNVLETTRSVCPECLSVIEAQIVRRNGHIIMSKDCADHGHFDSLISSDAEMYLRSLPYNKPGTQPLGYSTKEGKGCPWDCGICPEHQQHTCLALIEVTSRCNLNCPTCFAGSQPGFDLTLSQVNRMLDRFIELEPEPGVIQFSGGEPTLNPEILPMLRQAKKKGLRMIMLNTNGIRIAEDDRFLAELADIRPIIYLQFDGFRSETHLALRGKDLLDMKLKALDRMAKAKLDVVLVPAIEKQINHDEIGDIVRFALKHPAVCGIAFQPVTHAGRFVRDAFDPMKRETIPDVVHGIAEQSGEYFVESDFVPVPCCHPTCRYATYAYVDKPRKRVTPLPRVIEVDKYLNYITNRTIPFIDPKILKALEGMWSASSVPGSKTLADRFRCAICEPFFPGKANYLKKHIFTIVIQDFGDAYTMDLNTIKKCCIGELIPDGRIIPFCVFNSLGYREKVRSDISSGRIA
ncbi:MAG: radical SAM protein [Dehalogenimonas sp.]